MACELPPEPLVTEPELVELPVFELPVFELPVFELPVFELPVFELPVLAPLLAVPPSSSPWVAQDPESSSDEEEPADVPETDEAVSVVAVEATTALATRPVAATLPRARAVVSDDSRRMPSARLAIGDIRSRSSRRLLMAAPRSVGCLSRYTVPAVARSFLGTTCRTAVRYPGDRSRPVSGPDPWQGPVPCDPTCFPRPEPCSAYGVVMDRRIFGLENEYGVTCTFRGQRRLSPDEVARYLFRRVVSWGRSSNVFLRNGARLYLDVGSHPEYATPECDNVTELVTHDKAGERILEGLLVDAERRLHEEGIAGDVYLFKNNTDSAGNSYGCHENYLVGRHGEFSRLADILIPFLVTRQLICGAGKVLQTPRGAVYCVSQRAEHIWEGVVVGDHPVPADHQHPRRAARRRRALPPAARHRRRLEHVRDDDAAQGRRHRPGAAHDRGGHA